jgi:quercetin dioxygenase-like cupin family protein
MITLVALFRFIAMEGKPRKQKKQSQLKKGRTMNPLTQLKKIPILPLLIALTLVIAVAPARATPPCGLLSVALAPTGHFPSGLLDLGCTSNLPAWLLETIVKGNSDVYIIQNTFPPGAHTGWHTHPGPSLITVTAGTITAYDASNTTCTPKIYTAGQSFTDVGCGDVHLLRNEGSVNAVTVAVQIVPAGAPRRIDVPVPPSNCPLISCL